LPQANGDTNRTDNLVYRWTAHYRVIEDALLALECSASEGWSPARGHRPGSSIDLPAPVVGTVSGTRAFQMAACRAGGFGVSATAYHGHTFGINTTSSQGHSG
jgi:hypothetical protein